MITELQQQLCWIDWKEWSPADKESLTPMGPAADDELLAGRATGPYCTICSLSIISLAPSKREFFFAVRADLNSPHANWRLSSTSAGICFVITYPVHVRALAFVRIEHWSDSLMTLAIIILLLSPCAWPILCDRGIAILSAPGRRSSSPMNFLNMTAVFSSLCSLYLFPLVLIIRLSCILLIFRSIISSDWRTICVSVRISLPHSIWFLL